MKTLHMITLQPYTKIMNLFCQPSLLCYYRKCPKEKERKCSSAHQSCRTKEKGLEIFPPSLAQPGSRDGSGRGPSSGACAEHRLSYTGIVVKG